MRDPFDIIKSTRVTEKSSALNEKGQYVFEVALSATKQEIKHAVKRIYNKNVVSVNTMRIKPRIKRGRLGGFGQSGMTSAKKKAVVTLKTGEKIELI
ncbi:MAG: 50S ribosomal protein L23 [Verrucomicrobiota bacterium]|jgi:large subunit ribosomal protein L23